jgi:hypothetical protein
MKIQNLHILQHHLDHDAYIAHELEIRLLEHLPPHIKNEKKCDILRDCSAAMIMEGKFSEQAEFDVIIAHLIPLWQSDLTIFFDTIYQLLSSHGTFLFSTLGKRHAYELEALGDILFKAGFALPVVDKDHIQLRYDDRDSATHDVELSGLNDENILMIQEPSGNILLEIEVLYGYVSGKVAPVSDAIEIPLSHITKREQR